MSVIEKIFKKKAIHQALFVYAGSLVNGASLFALNIILARSLEKSSFGIFSLSILVLNTVAELSDFGLNTVLLRFAPYYISTNQEGKLNQLLKTIWKWRVSLTIFLSIGLALCAYPIAYYLFNQPAVAPYLLFTSLGIGGVVLLGFLATYLQARQRFYYHTTLQALKGFVRFCVIGVLFLLGVRNLFWYLAIYILVPWILFVCNFGVFPKNFRKYPVDDEIKKNLNQKLAKFSLWLTLSSFMSIITSRVDQVMISHYLGLAEVAVFAVAFQLVQLLPLVYNAINSVLMPKINSIKNKVELVGFIKKTCLWVAGVTVLIGILIYPSQYIIPLFFGAKYVSAIPVYLVLAYSLLTNIIAIPFSLTIITFNQTRLVAISAGIQLIVNVLGNLLFIPRYGIIGSAYSFAFSAVLLCVWNIVVSMVLLKRSHLNIE